MEYRREKPIEKEYSIRNPLKALTDIIKGREREYAHFLQNIESINPTRRNLQLRDGSRLDIYEIPEKEFVHLVLPVEELSSDLCLSLPKKHDLRGTKAEGYIVFIKSCSLDKSDITNGSGIAYWLRHVELQPGELQLQTRLLPQEIANKIWRGYEGQVISNRTLLHKLRK